MTHPYHSQPRVTVATARRQANMRMLIEALTKGALDSFQIGELLSMSMSGVRKYIRVGVEANVFKVDRRGESGSSLTSTYCIASQEMAARLLANEEDLRPTSKPRVRANTAEKRIAEAAAAGRRLIHNGDRHEYLRLEPLRPAKRDALVCALFGEPGATA